MPEEPLDSTQETELRDFSEVLQAVPPWEPDAEWFRRVRDRLMASELREPQKLGRKEPEIDSRLSG